MFEAGEAKGLFDSEKISKLTCLGRMGKPDEVAKVLCFLLSDDASYVTGGESFSYIGSVSQRFDTFQRNGPWMVGMLPAEERITGKLGEERKRRTLTLNDKRTSVI